MNERWLVSRRAILGGLSAAGMSAALGLRGDRALAQTAPAPRFVVWHMPEGMWNSAKRPVVNGTTLGPIFDKLDVVRGDMIVMNNLNMKSRDFGPGGDAHHRAMPHMLTGIEMVDANNAGGPSVDQKIAQAIGGSTKFKSLQFAVRIIYGDLMSRPIWSAASRVVPALQDPWDAYKRIFADFVPATGMAAAPATKFDLRKSVLDYALGEIASLRAKLPAADRERLDSYQDSLRELETRLATVPAAPLSCTQPTLGNKIDIASEPNFPTIGRLQMDMIVASLQCGLTRVASMQWANSNDQTSYSWLGVNALGHDLAHNTSNVDPSGQKKQTVFRWYGEQFAYFLSKLKSIPEGTGTMLDNTVVLVASEFGDSNGHISNNMTWLLGGNANGFFKPGRVIDCGGRSTNDVHTSLINAFGIADKTFGNPAYCAGPLAALRG